MTLNSFKEVYKNKLVLILLIVILGLGIFLRVHGVDELGMNNDQIATVPTGLVWYYPHDYYPGLASQAEPALGNFLMASGCMLSGEDFSGVTEIIPNFYPGRAELFGQEMVDATTYCRIPGIIFSILFLLGFSIFLFLFIDKYAALFGTAFIAFNRLILNYSTTLHVDIFLYFFLICSFIFLWLAFKSVKASNKETLYFVISGIFLALSFSVKMPAALWLIFGGFIILFKYRVEILYYFKDLFKKYLENISKESLKYGKLIRNLLFYSIGVIATLFFTFEFSLSNIFLVFDTYRSYNSDVSSFILNWDFLQTINNFLFSFNILDLIIFLGAIYVFYKILVKKNKTQFEQFILLISLPLILALLFTNTLQLARVFLSFAFIIFILMSLVFSQSYGIIKKKKIILPLLILYILFSFVVVYQMSPFYCSTCSFYCEKIGDNCNDPLISGYGVKPTAEFLIENMGEDESFINFGTSMIFFYVNPEEEAYNYMWRESFNEQFGHRPNFIEWADYYTYEDRTLRYAVVFLSVEPNEDPSYVEFDNAFTPNEIIQVNGINAVEIYDLTNLISS